LVTVLLLHLRSAIDLEMESQIPSEVRHSVHNHATPQSEGYQLRHEALQMIQQRSTGELTIDPTSLPATTNPALSPPAQDASRRVHSMKIFLLTFNALDRKSILDFLDLQPAVLNWFAINWQAILIVSESDATALSTIIHTQFPNMLFIITEIERGKTNGWMGNVVWDFINLPKSSGRWDFLHRPSSQPPLLGAPPNR
jgi:hypothetical protein